jgi:hypothetical protein
MGKLNLKNSLLGDFFGKNMIRLIQKLAEKTIYLINIRKYKNQKLIFALDIYWVFL